jgi:hypothetical protein
MTDQERFTRALREKLACLVAWAQLDTLEPNAVIAQVREIRELIRAWESKTPLPSSPPDTSTASPLATI